MLRGERWLVTGATGLVGTTVSAGATAAGVRVMRTSRSGGDRTIACDLRDYAGLIALLEATSPDRVVHLAALSKPAAVAANPVLAREVNVVATATIAAWCARNDRGLIFTSTDQVFSGEDGPYRESDPAWPATAYGQTKLEAEHIVLDAGGLVARLGWVLNDQPGQRPDFIEYALGRLVRGETVDAVDDEQRTPIYGSDLAQAILRLAELDRRGPVHVAGAAHTTPYQALADRAVAAGLDRRSISRISRRQLAPPGRPRDVRLDTTALRGLLTRGTKVAAIGNA
jgi:dTDP-4-dehydrorhamnose reductase